MKKKDSNLFSYFCLALVSIVYLQFKTNFLDVAPWLKVFVVSSAVMLVPGYFLLRIFFRSERADVFEAVPVALVLGLVFFSPFSFISYIAQLRLDTLINIYLFSCITLGIIDLFVMPRLATGKAEAYNLNDRLIIEDKNTQLWKKRLRYFLAAVLAVSFYLSVYFGGWISGDFIIHLPKVRQIVEMQTITYCDFFIKGLNKCVRAHNILHPLLAVISRAGYTDPINVWALCISIFAPVSLLALFASARLVFKDEIFAHLVTFLWFLWWGIFNMGFEGRQAFWAMGSGFPCPSHFLKIFDPIIMLFIFKYLYTGAKKYVYALPFIGICFAFIHMMMYLYSVFAVGAFFMGSIFFKNGIQRLSRKLLLCLVLVASIGFPYTFFNRFFPWILTGIFFGHIYR